MAGQAAISFSARWPLAEDGDTRNIPTSAPCFQCNKNGHLFPQTCFPKGSRLSLFLVHFEKMTEWHRLSIRLNRHLPKESIVCTMSVHFCWLGYLPLRLAACQSSALEKLILWKHHWVDPPDSCPNALLSAQMDFFHACA